MYICDKFKRQGSTKQGLKPILDTDFEYQLQTLKTKIDTQTEDKIGKNKYQ